MDPIEKSFKELVKNLSKLILLKNVAITKHREEIAEIIIAYAKSHTLKGLAEPLEIYHVLMGHQVSRVKLECGTAHCIECYNFFCIDSNWDPNNTFCTCERRIVPKYRASVQNNFKRIQALKEKCDNCENTKDKMDFAVITIHKCKLCTECIKSDYRLEKGFKNQCLICDQNYNDEEELILRSIIEESIPDEVKARYYAGQCFECEQEKDSRSFLEICADHHKICVNCNNLKDKENENCKCGQPFTVFK